MPRDRYSKRATDTAARPDELRGWRGTMKGQPPETHEPPSLKEDPSDVYVVGRAHVFDWDGPRRAAFARFVALANEFGLHVHEVPPDERKVRKKWAAARVTADDVLIAIEAKPGILFDDLVELWMASVDQKTPAAWKMARAKATTAVSRLAADFQIVKRKLPENGRLVLYVNGAEPREAS